MPVKKHPSAFSGGVKYLVAEQRKPKLDKSDEQNIEGKIIVITGANSGIGEAAALEFAKRGAVLVMPCRNIKRAETTLEKIKAAVPETKIDLMQLDLGDFNSVRKCAEQIRQKYPKIDILVNNAGFTTYGKQIQKNQDGYELNMAVNHLGPFLFTQLLLDNVKAAAPGSRILFTSSMAFEMGELDPEDFMLEKRGSFTVLLHHIGPYCNAKQAMNYCAKILAKQLVGTGVNVYTLCPGGVRSGFQEGGGFVAKLAAKWFGLKPEKGAETILYCALMKSVANQTGQMYRCNGLWEGAMDQLDDDVGQKIWDKSMEYVGLYKT